MEFIKLKDEVKSLGLAELRADDANYLETVFAKEGMLKLNEILKKYLGEAVWPASSSLDLKVQEAINGFGGIHAGQTLYFKSEGASATFAMLWPWGDGRNVTVKIVHK